MTLDQKIGQLFIAPACPLRSDDHLADWAQLMDEYHVGGVILKQGTLADTAQWVTQLQAKSEYPLLITADAEWGLGMRIIDGDIYPRNVELGKLKDLFRIREIGKKIGVDCSRIGIDVNFSPVADVNNNPNNQIIGTRSFGKDPTQVSKCVIEMALGLEEGGVFACAKHFPGHGDTEIDSHADLPLIPHGRDRLDRVELVPFKAAIQNGISFIMSAHILVPALDPKFPATMSKAIMTDLLRKELGFKGIIVTDALNMKALTQEYSTEEIALAAHLAGCDLLLYGDHMSLEVDLLLRDQIPRAFLRLKKAYETGEIGIDFLDEKVMRILRVKEKLL